MLKNKFGASDCDIKAWRADLCPFAAAGNLNLPAGTIILNIHTFGDAAINAMDMQTRECHALKSDLYLSAKLNITAKAGAAGGSVVVEYVLPIIEEK